MSHRTRAWRDIVASECRTARACEATCNAWHVAPHADLVRHPGGRMSRPARVKGDMRGQRSRPEFWFDTGSGSRVESSIKMRAAVLVGIGDVDQLELRDVPEPTTAPGEVKVRVVATSINPIDWKLREGA